MMSIIAKKYLRDIDRLIRENADLRLILTEQRREVPDDIRRSNDCNGEG